MTRSEKFVPLDEYARLPGVQRWLVTCQGCGRVGYRPDTPTDKEHSGIRRGSEALSVNEAGMCAVCAEAASRATDAG
jgi:hypothetical protein